MSALPSASSRPSGPAKVAIPSSVFIRRDQPATSKPSAASVSATARPSAPRPRTVTRRSRASGAGFGRQTPSCPVTCASVPR